MQLQLYNIFNQVQFTTMNTALQFRDDPNVPGTDNLILNTTNPGRYTAAIAPRQFGITFRMDFCPPGSSPRRTLPPRAPWVVLLHLPSQPPSTCTDWPVR